jgi:2,4-dienoyl-CoA reductase-like NADH-dependent reductase (Old Yellow Enzyme family)
MPIMVTGGVRRRVIAEDALRPSNGFPGIAMIGIATAMAFEPDLPSKWRRGDANEIAIPIVEWKKTALANVAKMAITKVQLRRLGDGLKPKSNVSPLLALI